MLLDETISLLDAHARAANLLAKLRARDAACSVWLTGSIRRLEERVDRVEILVCGSMPLTAEEIGSGFLLSVTDLKQCAQRLLESTGGSGFLSEIKSRRQRAGLVWPLPPGIDEHRALADTFGAFIPPWLRADAVDRSDPPLPRGDALVIPATLSVDGAKRAVADYLDSCDGPIFVADDGGMVSSVLALLGKRAPEARIRLSTVVTAASRLAPDARGSIVILDASSMKGDSGRVCDELNKLCSVSGKPVLLFNPTGRLPLNDMRGNGEEIAAMAAACAALNCPVLACGHLARLSPGDSELAVFLKAGCHIALGSGGPRPERCSFGLDCATAMAARAGARPRDIWRPK